ncbi:small ribosomal subunit uS5 domain containing protein [Babesia gibsoni]|uniref:Small ribosomal subunit uS5 domain containing protein n=1 Tax=Babesia gibsoni TaxID=33632 RepID=A0AAD8UTA6_BABGI|nr:small ribosomal subunit uS5 domain containing protein [Babesia gibsoni]
MLPLSVAWHTAVLLLLHVVVSYRISHLEKRQYHHPGYANEANSPWWAKRSRFTAALSQVEYGSSGKHSEYHELYICARPRKAEGGTPRDASEKEDAETAEMNTTMDGISEAPVKKKRGRPKKVKVEPDSEATAISEQKEQIDGVGTLGNDDTQTMKSASKHDEVATVANYQHPIPSMVTDSNDDDDPYGEPPIEEPYEMDGSQSDIDVMAQIDEVHEDAINSQAKGRKSFVEKLDEQLKSVNTKLPEACYGEDIYSTVDNTKLPEGCKTIMDFLNIPKNFDFKSMVDLALHGTESLEGLSAYGGETVQTVENPRYTGKYPDSLFDYMFNPVYPKRRYSTSKSEPDAVDLGTVYDELKGKQVDDLMPPEVESPVDRIDENYFMFDGHNYIRHYLTHLNQYKYDVISSHHHKDDTLAHYLNNEYIQRIPKKFPPDRDHTDRMREYFMGLMPEVMDNLVNLIRNDPNKYRTPSPPMHDMSLAPGFRLPDYMRHSYVNRDTRTGGYQEEDFIRYSSLQGLHDPENHLVYPYADMEPLYQRQLLSTYLDIVKSGELGEPETYKKFKSQAASIRNEMYTDQTKLPSEIYGNNPEEEITSPPIEGPVTLTKVYERGSRKCSVALVYLEPGNGHIIINNRDGYQYVRYCTQRIREMLEPLDALYVYKKFNIVAVVHGGGISGQAGAIRHALSRYLTRVLAPKVEPYLSMRDLTKADTRQVERKKTNLRKARKEEHYSKR